MLIMFEIFTQILDITTKIREILNKMFKKFTKIFEICNGNSGFLRELTDKFPLPGFTTGEGIYPLITEKKAEFLIIFFRIFLHPKIKLLLSMFIQSQYHVKVSTIMAHW